MKYRFIYSNLRTDDYIV